MKPVKLSLCIPTYNFGRFIDETLRSILEQDGADKIEVVVVDGASLDNTADVVTALQRQYPQIKYVRLPVKGGIDRDMAKSVELATGEYCWLFSSDDTMRRGALELALNEIKQGYDLFLCGHTECTLDMQFISEYPIFRLNSEAVFDLANPKERARYASLAINTEAFFSFMGGIIVKKSKWDSVSLNEAFVGSCWAHAARLFEIMARGLTVKYVARAYLNRRTSNDSFMDKGFVNRYRLAIEGYPRIADTFFGQDSIEAFHVRRVLRNEYPVAVFVHALKLCRESPERENEAVLDNLVRKVYCDDTPNSRLSLRTYAAHSAESFPSEQPSQMEALPSRPSFRAIRAALREFERNLLRPSFRAIRAGLRKFERNLLRPSFRAIRATLRKFERNLLRPSFRAIRAALRKFERNLLRPSFRAIRAAFGADRDRIIEAPAVPDTNPSPTAWGRTYDLSKKQLVELDGFGLYVMPDDYMGASILSERFYERHVTKVIRSVLKRGDVFLDLGANMGFFTFLAASLVKNEGKVIAFEPNPQNLQLMYSTLLVSPGFNVKIYPYAVSDSPGITKFVTVGLNGGVVNEHVIDPNTNEKQEYNLLVQRVVLDELLKDEPRIDLIKIDVEAHEPAAVRGMESLLRKHRPKVITEFHPWALKLNNKEPPVAYLDQLYALGYFLSIIEDPSGKIISVSSSEDVLTYWTALNNETVQLDLLAQPRHVVLH